MGSGPRWTQGEDRILAAAYSAGGLRGALAALPGRTWSAIASRRQALDLRRPATSPKWTSAEDRVIRRLYPTGGAAAVAAILRRPQPSIRFRAMTLGVRRHGTWRGEWSADEERLLRETFPDGGRMAAALVIKSRTAKAIASRAAVMGIYYAPGPEEMQRRRRRDSAQLQAMRQENMKAGACKCGRPRKERRRQCEACLRYAGRTAYKKRYGVHPVAVCERCLVAGPHSKGPRRRRHWAIPGSPYCARHQRATHEAFPTMLKACA